MKTGIKKSTIFLIIGCIIGLSMLLYPRLADYWNTNHTTKAISNYVEKVTELKKEDYTKLWNEALSYNSDLRSKPLLSDDLKDRYYKCLNVDGSGIMGYIEIGRLNLSLPVYHGTSEKVLQSSIGHIDWTSLPTGGAGNHCAVSGHRGLASARLFTDLDSLREGDHFELYVLNEKLTYEVDQIRTVEPDNISNLAFESGRDFCTLVTCTPYGINTHRLLVRGHRIKNDDDEIRVISEAVQIDELIVAPLVALPFLLALTLRVMLKRPESRKNRKAKRREAKLKRTYNYDRQ